MDESTLNENIKRLVTEEEIKKMSNKSSIKSRARQHSKTSNI